MDSLLNPVVDHESDSQEFVDQLISGTFAIEPGSSSLDLPSNTPAPVSQATPNNDDQDKDSDSEEDDYDDSLLVHTQWPPAPEVGARQMRYVYMVTYAAANLASFPTQSVFALAVLSVLRELNFVAERWIATKEKHLDGQFHYHMVFHLQDQKRWKQIKLLLQQRNNIVCHFRSETAGYAAAYEYVTKASPPKWITQSEGQEGVLGAIRRTDACMQANVSKGRSNEQNRQDKRKAANNNQTVEKKKKKKPDLRHKDIVRHVIEWKVGSLQQLQSIAEIRRRLDEWDLFNYLAIHPKKQIEDMIARCWETTKAPEVAARVNLPRETILANARSAECVEGCLGRWLTFANQIMSYNPSIDQVELKRVVVDNIQFGRCKDSTVFFIGPTDCGKSFLLLPLEKLFKTFSNPTVGTYNWLGIEDAECCFLNDFRWSAGLIQWADLLRFCAGERLSFSRPNNLYPSDYQMMETNTMPIFGTGKSKTQWRGSYQAVDAEEDKMLNVRMKYFSFSYTIPNPVRRGVPPCVRCFAEFLLG